jgi:hypothetical protein
LSSSVFFWCVVLAMAFGLLASVSAAGQTGPLGTSLAGFPVNPAPFLDAPISPFMTYTDASYGTGGIALRNRGKGVLHVSGVTGPVQDAYLYWAILFNTATPDKELYKIKIRPLACPDGNDPWCNDSFKDDSDKYMLKGTLIGIGGDPCWGSVGTAVFRAQVPKWIAKGNGAYEVVLKPSASGLWNGADPWVEEAFPEDEGASLVIIGTGAYTVGIYDAGFTATTWVGYTLTYTLNLPATLTTDALWDSIGYDGQVGGSRTALAGVYDETTFINGTQVSGPGCTLSFCDSDSDWNGNDGTPIPQLWDDAGHDILAALLVAPGPPPTYATTATIAITSISDCIGTVFNVLAVQ